MTLPGETLERLPRWATRQSAGRSSALLIDQAKPQATFRRPEPQGSRKPFRSRIFAAYFSTRAWRVLACLAPEK